MAFRRTSLGAMSDEQALAEIRDALELTGGNILRAAHVLGFRSRRQLYRYLDRLDPEWKIVNEVRAAAMRRFLTERAKLLGKPAPTGVELEPWKR